VDEYDTVAVEKEMSKLVQTTFKQRSEFVCLLYAFEQKFTPLTVSHLLHVAIINKLVTLTTEALESDEKPKEHHERALKLIALYRLLNESLQVPFGKLTSQAGDEAPLLSLYTVQD